MTVVSERALSILGRFPRHMDLARPDKVFADVVDAIAEGLELQTTQVGEIRRAHRLGFAGEERDLLLLAATHDLHDDDVAVLPMRMVALRAARAVLRAKLPPLPPPAPPPPPIDLTDPDIVAAFAALSALIGPPAASFAPWPTEGSDATPAVHRLVTALGALLAYGSEMDLLRRRLKQIIALHRAGNGTIGALLGASANQLDLDIEQVRHSSDGYWHLAYCRDRLRLVRPEPPGTTPPLRTVTPDVELVALEENPFTHQELEPFPCAHAQRFGLDHPALEPSPVSIHVVGVGDATMWPMVVDRDAGFGLAYHGAVADGAELIFGRDGAATLDGADVTGQAWAFTGAVFAEDGELHRNDFRFTDDAGAVPATAPQPPGRPAVFAVAAPFAAAFDPGAPWPHAAAALPFATLAVGQSRWAYFVRVATYGTVDDAPPPPPRDVPSTPYFNAGEFDTSVWAGPPSTTAGKVGFDWDEREAFAVKVWLPMRFQHLDDPADPPGHPSVSQRVRAALDRHRAAGVHVYVDHASDLWTLGSGVLRELDSSEPEGIVVNGTRLWP